MTSDQLKAAAAVMLAASEGKAIEYRMRTSNEWREVADPSFAWGGYEYRIKPEPRKVKVRLYDDGIGYLRVITHMECPAAGWKPVSDIVEIEVKDA